MEENMAIELREYTTYIEEEVLPLYKSVGWSLYVNQPEKLKQAYEHSLHVIGAYDGERLVGLIRVVGDGVSIIFIQDLLVHEEYHRQGIGTQLIVAILEKYKEVRQKALLTDDFHAQKAFYRKAGFMPISETKGICFVNYTF